MGKHRLSDAALGPSGEARVNHPKFPETFREVAPRNAGAVVWAAPPPQTTDCPALHDPRSPRVPAADPESAPAAHRSSHSLPSPIPLDYDRKLIATGNDACGITGSMTRHRLVRSKPALEQRRYRHRGICPFVVVPRGNLPLFLVLFVLHHHLILSNHYDQRDRRSPLGGLCSSRAGCPEVRAPGCTRAGAGGPEGRTSGSTRG